ncbi:hypothetical protein [Vibrio cholerae]|uniref:hypothetical protein n=1 Tax=Vibrio cholerae TaxID=666 RepID=UPI00130219CB|nr:hypothetical protein [Vibrio cholerae]EJL6764551.1 hypothetical protein [Vibrio cholerae]EKF9465779.1 hypothetical protein [Vibrio cholerae]MCE3055326.1 hypothetical protein [Vibrio cholerae]
MKVVPMIFNTDMVKALMAGDKVVTRRPVKIDYERGMNGPVVRGRNGEVSVLSFAPIAGLCPFGNIGDLIYVRETFRMFNHSDECGCSDYCACPPSGTPVYFATCGGDSESKWKPSIHMPRTASRLTLKVTDVRIERVQDITEEQAIKEGINKHHKLPAFKSPIGYHTSPVYAFEELWNSIYGNWEENPYVWVIEFEVIHQNVDKYLESVKERP